MQSATLEKIGQTPCKINKDHRDDPSYSLQSGNLAAETMQSQCSEFVKKRSAPDVVVMGPQGQILFVSHRGFSVLNLLEANAQNTEEHKARLRLTQILERLRITVFSQAKTLSEKTCKNTPNALFSFKEQAVSLRGQLLKDTSGTPNFVMILIEQIKRKIQSAALNQCALAFTPREQAVLRYLKKGFTNKEIASALNIGVHTVKDHVKRIMKKVNARTRTGIAGKLEEILTAQG